MEKGSAPPPPYGDQQGGYQPQHYPPSQGQYQQQPYPPQQPMSYPPQQQQQQPHVITQVVVTQPASFDQHPVTVQCPHCHSNITTTVHLTNGLAPWLICGGLVLLGCWLGCCIIPFCIKDLKDAEHRCPNCQQVVGKHKLMG